jgi:hypothetical protein
LVPTPESLSTGPPFTGSPEVVYFHGSARAGTCGAGPSGFDLPGGFGWLDETDCRADIEVGDWVDDKPGNAAPGCIDFDDLRNQTVLLPVYDDTNDLTGTNGKYHVVGFAAFHITGYRFPSHTFGGSCPGEPGGSGTCIKGHFTGFHTTGTVFGGPNMGVTIIKLVG